MKKILIVDDAVFMRLILKEILEKNEYEVIGQAKDGMEAVEKYKLLKPDIVTLDVTMPMMDGIEALKQIKAYNKEATVMMISSMGQEAIVKQATDAGAKGFIVKPYDEETIVRAFNKL